MNWLDVALILILGVFSSEQFSSGLAREVIGLAAGVGGVALWRVVSTAYPGCRASLGRLAGGRQPVRVSV